MSSSLSADGPSTATIASLRIEHLAETLGVGTPAPRLSWAVETEDPNWAQTGYRIEFLPDGADQPLVAEVESAEQLLVPWPFEPLTSRARGVLWVQALSAAGSSEKSEPRPLEAGLLNAADWTAKFVSPVTLDSVETPAPIVFADAVIAGAPVSARLYVAALGTYLFSINGKRVADHVLAPGWTSYSHRLRYQAFDVTEMIMDGDNRLEALLGNGWYRGQLTWDKNRDTYGDRLALLAQLELTFSDGRTQVIGTDDSWQASASGILFDDLYDGQRTDLRLPMVADDHEAEKVEVIERDLETLVAPTGPPVRITEVVPALSVQRSPSGKLLVDFGQNLVGWVRLRVSGGQAGDEITLRHAEVLENGELGVRPLRKALATDSYLLAGPEEQILEPCFTFHGFRYAEVDGVDDLDPSQLEGVVVHSDLRRTGWFECSDADLNQLHANVVWGMRGNFVDVPTDCPQRDERLGWTGDLQVFSPSASFLYDSAGLLTNWLADLAADQAPDGGVPYVIPNVLKERDQTAAAWGDAATVVPSVMYERYADRAVVAVQFESMKGWVDRINELAGANGLWEGGFQFGDWLDPTAPPENAFAAKADPDVVATAHLIHSAQLVAWAADLLGHAEDAAHYRGIADHSLAAFQREYVTAGGRVLSDCTTVYGLALVWDLLPPELVEAAGNRLAAVVEKSGFKISTGFVGTPLIMDALTRTGHLDVAYQLLLQKECPSWLYPITMGATTIWERWDSMLPDGSINPGQMTSFNHYALGAVADWMQRSLAGLAPAAPGYRKIIIKPQVPRESSPGDKINFAQASHHSGYGPISVAWRRSGGEFSLDATVPPGVSAEVWLPDAAEPIKVGHGTHSWTTEINPAPSIREGEGE